MEAVKLQVASEAGERIKDWLRAQQHVDSAKRELNSAEVELLNATDALGRYLSPDDAGVGEVFHIWYGDGLVQVEKTSDSGNGDYRVSWRKRANPKFLR